MSGGFSRSKGTHVFGGRCYRYSHLREVINRVLLGLQVFVSPYYTLADAQAQEHSVLCRCRLQVRRCKATCRCVGISDGVVRCSICC